MNLDNFIVRPNRLYVEKYQEGIAWHNITLDARTELADHVAGLPSAFEDDDLAAKQFDYLLLQSQLAVLNKDPSFARFQKTDHGYYGTVGRVGQRANGCG